MKNILLIGGGGHCLSCIDVIELEKKFKIIGLFDNKLKGNQHNYKILGNDKNLKTFYKKSSHALITLGQIKNFKTRNKLFLKSKQIGYKFPKIISPLAYVSNKAKIGEGTIVMHGAIINAGAKIGKNCIVNTNALVEHDVVVEDNCHLSTRSTLNGGVRLKQNSFIGSHTVVKQYTQIGKNSFINANLFVNENLKDNAKKYA